MNQAQVLDAWRVDRQRREQQQATMREQAAAFVARHPELCDEKGNPCSYAIVAALHYKRLGGPFDAAVVRRHRDMMRARSFELAAA